MSFSQQLLGEEMGLQVFLDSGLSSVMLREMVDLQALQRNPFLFDVGGFGSLRWGDL